MKNALKYYYDIDTEDIYQNNNNYYFDVKNIKYCLSFYNDNSSKIKKVYNTHVKLLDNRIPCHQIILNKANQILTFINNSAYILLRINIMDKKIETKDILYFSSLNYNFINLNGNDSNEFLTKDNLSEMWSNKIDYFEYQVNHMGKRFPLVRESFNYYAGLTETAIQIMKLVESSSKYNVILSHRRIGGTSRLFDLYNPLEFVVDSRIRDICEYYKDLFLNGEDILDALKKYIVNARLDATECNLLLARLLFPSYYFDIYEKIVVGSMDEDKIVKITEKANQYEDIIKELYKFIKSFYQIQEIEWLLKG